MKYSTLLRTAAAVLGLCSMLAQAQISTADRIVAIVNRDAITSIQLQQRVQAVKQNLNNRKVQLPPDDILQQQVLNQMIMDHVQVQYATDRGIKIDDKQLEAALTRMADQNQASLPEFRQKVEASGLVWKDFREDIRQEMLIGRLKEREVDSKVTVSESEIDDYLKLAAGRAQQQYHLAQIMIPLPENASPEQIQAKRARIQAAVSDYASGRSFASVAATYSEDRNATSGGDMGWRAAGTLPKALTDLLDKLQPGQVTDIVRTPGAFHVFQLVEKKDQEEKVVEEQTHVRHILKRSNEITSMDDARQKLVQIRERLLNGEDFAELAKAFSDDGSASNGGDLGWISPGETVPQFEDAMNKLKVGAISEIVQSPFGFHVIQVLERRKQDVTAQRARFKIRNELKQRKAEELYDDWLRQLQDSARIVIKLKDE